MMFLIFVEQISSVHVSMTLALLGNEYGGRCPQFLCSIPIKIQNALFLQNVGLSRVS